MASSDDFRQQLKAGNITEALALALSETLELTITTWVASAEDEVQAEQARPGQRLCTRMNLIEGDIDNEIGDQFLTTGPYRELRQFHLEQVAQGSKIVQSNLKSLQRLFEVLVALRYPNTQFTHRSIGVESPLSPATDTLPEAPLVEELPASTLDELFESPGPGVDANFPEAQLVIDELLENPAPVVEVNVPEAQLVEEPPASTIDELFVSFTPPPEPILEEPLPSETLDALLATSTDQEERLDLDPDKENWDDPILELLESLPPASSESLDSETPEDWRHLVQENPESDSAAPNSAANQDWVLTLEDLERSSASVEPGSEGPDVEAEADWGDIVTQEEPPPTLPTSKTDSLTLDDEDWGLAAPAEPASPPPASGLGLDALTLDDDDEWDNWAREEPPASETSGVNSIDSLNLGEDEDWGDLLEDSEPLATLPELNDSAADLALDADWDDFTNQDLDPNSVVIDVEARPDSAEPRENPTPAEWTFKENSSGNKQTPENQPLQDLFDDESQQTQPDTAGAPDNSGDGLEEGLFFRKLRGNSTNDYTGEGG